MSRPVSRWKWRFSGCWAAPLTVAAWLIWWASVAGGQTADQATQPSAAPTEEKAARDHTEPASDAPTSARPAAINFGLLSDEGVPPAFAKRFPENVADLRSIETHVQRLLPGIVPATVGVRVGHAGGSGVVVSADGLVLTAGHVAGEPNLEANFIFPDGKRARGVTLGVNRRLDIGMLRILDKGPWPYLEIGDSAPFAAGDWVIATGQPGGVEDERSPPVRLGRILYRLGETICTDCTLVGGDSGGPLINMRGELIGIHSRIGRRLISNFHVPINTFRTAWQQLLASESWGDGAPTAEPRFSRPLLGLAARVTSSGCQVTQVFAGRPAARAGVLVGDLIERVGEQSIGTVDDLGTAVLTRSAGEALQFHIRRNGEAIAVPIRLGRIDQPLPGSLEAPRQRSTNPQGNREPQSFRSPSAARNPLQAEFRPPPDEQPQEHSGDGSGSYPTAGWQFVEQRESTPLSPLSRLSKQFRDAIQRYSIPRSRLKGGPHVKSAFREVVAEARAGTVEVIDGGQPVALGGIVGPDGWVVTKASQLEGAVECRLQDGRQLPADIVGVSLEFDVAMLKLDARDLPVLPLDRQAQTTVGQWVATVGPQRDPAAVGVISVEPRDIPSRPGYLGVMLDQIAAGPRVLRVYPGSGAHIAGVLVNDIITSLGGEKIASRDDLVDQIRQHSPGEAIELTVQRDESTLSLSARLSPMLTGVRPNREQFQNLLGGQLSGRRFGFDSVLQHDSVLKPQECGGPLVNLDGRVIGFNIARAGRTESYAVPTRVLISHFFDLMSGNLAPQKQKTARSSDP